jgi:error-prone DNA polymerase
MGFYSPSTILQDAERHGVTVLDVNVTKSEWDCTLEAGALRIGFRLVKGFSEKAARRVEEARRSAEFDSLDDLVRRAGLHKDELEMLAEAGALESLVKGRRNALWQSRAPRVGGLFEKTDVVEPKVELPALREAEQLLLDYGRKGLSVGDHPMKHLRGVLRKRGVLDAGELSRAKQGARVEVAGLVICRQQPGTASGVVFITLEDEKGFANLVLWNRVYERLRLVARHSTLLLARGVIDRQNEQVDAPIVHVIVDDLERLDVPGKKLPSLSRDFH